jgi:hypothetical protein
MKRALAVVALALAAAPATADAAWQYRGSVADAKATAIELTVHHQGQRPASVLQVFTGSLSLDCQRGSVRRHLQIGVVPSRIRRRQFSDSLIGDLVTGGGHSLRINADVRGEVGRRRGAGFLRLTMTYGGRRGKCTTGRERWRARRMP